MFTDTKKDEGLFPVHLCSVAEAEAHSKLHQTSIETLNRDWMLMSSSVRELIQVTMVSVFDLDKCFVTSACILTSLCVHVG